MSDFVDKAVLDECRSSVKEEIDDIRETVHLVKEMKQDRIKPMVIAMLLVPVFLWMAGVSITGLIWGASLTAQVGYLQKLNEMSTIDRYYAADADKDFALRDERILHNEEAIAKNRQMIEDLRTKHHSK